LKGFYVCSASRIIFAFACVMSGGAFAVRHASLRDASPPCGGVLGASLLPFGVFVRP